MNHVLHTSVLVTFSLVQEAEDSIICFTERALTRIKLSGLGALIKTTLLEATEYSWNITGIFIG